MNLEDVEKELKWYEVTDLYSAIKLEILEILKNMLQEKSNTNIIDFKNEEDLDDIVNNLESHFKAVISDYVDEFTELKKIKKKNEPER